MAIARLGAIVAGIAGSLGEVTFANARGALVLRKRQWPPNHHTAATTDRKHAYSQIWREWQGLDPDAKQSWYTAAASLKKTNRLGQSLPMQAWRLFFTAKIGPTFRGVASPDYFYADPSLSFNTDNQFTCYQDGPFELHRPSAATGFLYGFTARAARSLSTSPIPAPRRFAPASFHNGSVYSVNLHDPISAAIGEPKPDEYISLRARFSSGWYPYARTQTWPAPVTPAGPELIPNGDFEAPWVSGTPPSWTKSGTYDIFKNPFGIYGDTQTLGLNFPATAAVKYLYQTSLGSIQSGHTYRLSFALRATTGTLYRIIMYTPGTGYWTPFTDLSPAIWTRYEYEWSPVASGSNLDIYISNPADVAAAVELDNISFREVL